MHSMGYRLFTHRLGLNGGQLTLSCVHGNGLSGVIRLFTLICSTFTLWSDGEHGLQDYSSASSFPYHIFTSALHGVLGDPVPLYISETMFYFGLSSYTRAGLR
jgi:hypothetical protein